MKTLDAGHVYELDELDGNTEFGGQVLTFVKRIGDNFPGNNNRFPGTTLQEVLRALIERIKYLNSQHPCAENDAIIGLLQTSIFLLETRAARNHGHTLKIDSMALFMLMEKCPKCFHIKCEEHK